MSFYTWNPTEDGEVLLLYAGDVPVGRVGRYLIGTPARVRFTATWASVTPRAVECVSRVDFKSMTEAKQYVEAALDVETETNGGCYIWKQADDGSATLYAGKVPAGYVESYLRPNQAGTIHWIRYRAEWIDGSADHLSTKVFWNLKSPAAAKRHVEAALKIKRP